jgi:hypothetical protein
MAYREFVHADGDMTIYTRVPRKFQGTIEQLFQAIGYWGQSSSLASCAGVRRHAPKTGDFAIPLRLVNSDQCLGNYFTAFVTVFHDQPLDWSDIIPDIRPGKRSPLRIELYVWPLVLDVKKASGCQHSFRSLDQVKESRLKCS